MQLQRDEILEMARQAYFYVSEDGTSKSTNNPYGIIYDELEIFAKLVTAKAVEREREACAKMCEESNDIGSSYGLAQAIRARGRE